MLHPSTEGQPAPRKRAGEEPDYETQAVILPPVKDGLWTISPEQAEALLAAHTYERQDRHLTPGGREHISVLADIMQRGQWRKKEKIDFSIVPGGRTEIVNGHHRFAAQALAGVPIQWIFAVHHCEDVDAVSALYYTFDTNIRKRTNQNILSAARAAERFNLTKTTADALFSAVPLIVAGFDFRKSSQDVVQNRVIDRRMEVMSSFQDEARLLFDAINGAPIAIKRRLLNQGPFAVGLVTFRAMPNKAEMFWRGVAENDGLAAGDPRSTYRTALMTTNAKGSESTARLAASAWNAFYQERKSTYFKPTKAPFHISGTKYGA